MLFVWIFLVLMLEFVCEVVLQFIFFILVALLGVMIFVLIPIIGEHWSSKVSYFVFNSNTSLFGSPFGDLTIV